MKIKMNPAPAIRRGMTAAGMIACAATFSVAMAANPPVTAPSTQPAATQMAHDERVPQPARSSLVGQVPRELKVRRSEKTGFLLVSPLIDGQEVGWFILDTGAGMSCLDAAIVKKLNLPDAGETSARGTGGEQATKFRRVKSLAL